MNIFNLKEKPIREFNLNCPLKSEDILKLEIGDKVFLSGHIYSARDAVHKHMFEALKNSDKLPIDLQGETIYYLGPSPARPGSIIGAAGPTTGSRMDIYTPSLLRHGLKVMIGKGDRSPEVVESIKEFKAVYLISLGGAGAFLSKFILNYTVIAYPELGPEALAYLEVKDFPTVVAIDSKGNSLYKEIKINNKLF